MSPPLPLLGEGVRGVRAGCDPSASLTEWFVVLRFLICENQRHLFSLFVVGGLAR